MTNKRVALITIAVFCTTFLIAFTAGFTGNAVKWGMTLKLLSFVNIGTQIWCMSKLYLAKD